MEIKIINNYRCRQKNKSVKYSITNSRRDRAAAAGGANHSRVLPFLKRTPSWLRVANFYLFIFFIDSILGLGFTKKFQPQYTFVSIGHIYVHNNISN